MTKAKAVDIREWERAEIERSAAEAAGIDTSDLRFSEAHVARYFDPPAETPYSLEYAFHLLGDVSGQTVLDFGCGNGENTVMLGLKGARVISMDISPDSIGVARRRAEANGVSDSVEFLVGSAHDIPLADASVDVVFGIAILHHLDLGLTSREVKRVLRPGGRAIFLEPMRNSAFVNRVRGMIPYQSPDVSPYERPLTEAELREFAGGCREFRARAFRLPFVSVVEVVPPLRRFTHPAYRLDGRLLKRFPALGRYGTNVVVEIVR